MSPDTPTPDDARLAHQGDREALERVLSSWWPRVRRWALYATGDASLADDACQEALLRVVRHLDGYDPARPFGPWLRRIVHRAGLDQLARHGRHAAREVPGDESTFPHPTPPRPDRALDLAQHASHARAAFARLSPRQREALTLVDLDGLTPAEAAPRMGIEPSGVRAHLAQGRKELRRHLLRTHGEVLPLLREHA
jgi:RNA polymerase sigma-70 factor (ECF subfamily)